MDKPNATSSTSHGTGFKSWICGENKIYNEIKCECMDINDINPSHIPSPTDIYISSTNPTKYPTTDATQNPHEPNDNSPCQTFDDFCHVKQYFDTNTCTCQCIDVECGENKIYDEIACQCIDINDINPSHTPAPTDSYISSSNSPVLLNQPQIRRYKPINTPVNTPDNDNNDHTNHLECHKPQPMCHTNQIYDTNICKCRCLWHYSCDPQEYYNTDQCQCIHVTDHPSPEPTRRPSYRMCPTPLPICNEYQIYDDNTCNCICKPLDLDEEDQYKCNEYEIFDIKTCDCKPLCDNISADSCHDKQYLDVDSCTCECKDFESYGSGFKAICGDNKIYNEQQCECVETEIFKISDGRF